MTLLGKCGDQIPGQTYFPLYLLAILLNLLPEYTSFDDRHFMEIPHHHMTALPTQHHDNVTLSSCANFCLKETSFLCRSFQYQPQPRTCFLFDLSLDDPEIELAPDPGTDFYQSAYIKRYRKLSSYRLSSVRTVHNGVSLEGCARICYLETQYRCLAFQYGYMQCFMSDKLLEYAPRTEKDFIEVYERIEDDSESSFVNVGSTHLIPTKYAVIYQHPARNISLRDCAERCLNETELNCRSFDYVVAHAGGSSTCRLSKWTMATPGVLLENNGTIDSFHFERKGSWARYFYSSPYAVDPGNYSRLVTNVTMDTCAELCLRETSIICRAFHYQAVTRSCTLSSESGSDIVLLTETTLTESHHFEMKPLLDCGGNLTDAEGGFGSPNWPHPYSRRHYCVWQINISKHKVIRLRFTYFDLAGPIPGSCSESHDRLVLAETPPGGPEESYCITADRREVVTRSNRLFLYFFSYGHTSGQGFRAFYSTEWPCNIHIHRSHGEIASPLYPQQYKRVSKCFWIFSAKDGYRISLNFTSFDLDRHKLGHCTKNFDHVEVRDGGSLQAPQIGFFCGKLSGFTIQSTGRSMYVQFASDAASSGRGFLASYNFEKITDNTTVFAENVTTVSNIPAAPNIPWNSGIHTGTADLDDRARPGQVNYHSMMWAALGTLVSLLLVICVIFIIVWRYFRRKVRAYKHHDMEGDGEELVLPEEMPLQPGGSGLTEIQTSSTTDRSRNGHVRFAEDVRHEEVPHQDFSNVYFKDTDTLTCAEVNLEA